jgi:SOS-response transcriptional repressor LexA
MESTTFIPMQASLSGRREKNESIRTYMTEAVGNRIRTVRKAAELTQVAFAARLLARIKSSDPKATLTRGAVGNWELTGKVSREHLAIIAEEFDTSLDWLNSGIGSRSRTGGVSTGFRQEIGGILGRNTSRAINFDKDFAASPKTFVVVGTAEAGKFFPMDEIQADPDLPATVSGDLSERFPAVSHLAFRVKGDSMDGAGIQHGDFVIAVDWIEAGLSMETESGSIVVVERILFNGQARELTVKYLEVRADVYLLHPRSSNPKHKSITVPRDEADDGTEIRIRALVVGVTRSLERKRWTPPEV